MSTMCYSEKQAGDPDGASIVQAPKHAQKSSMHRHGCPPLAVHAKPAKASTVSHNGFICKQWEAS